MDIFDEYYDNHNLGERSRYSEFNKKYLVIEAEHLHDSLWEILQYLNKGGTDLDVIRGEVMDGLYESRI